MKNENNKKVFLKLSEEGKQAVLGHARFHEMMYQDLYGMLKDLKIDDLKLFGRIFSTLETHLDAYLQEKNELD